MLVSLKITAENDLGVTYKASLFGVRSTSDVIVNSGNKKIGVARLSRIDRKLGKRKGRKIFRPFLFVF